MGRSRFGSRTHYVLAVSLLMTLCAGGQELSKPQRIDTVAKVVKPVAPVARFDQPVLQLPLFDELAVTPGYYTSMLFEPSAATPYFFSRKEVEIMDLSMPWKLQLARENEHRTMYSILGAVEAGGVAYLAYKHIQKHGWK